MRLGNVVFTFHHHEIPQRNNICSVTARPFLRSTKKFLSQIMQSWNQPWFRRTVLTHFENILEFKSTLKSTLTFKKTVFAHFQINLDFKATWIFRRWIIFTVSLVSFEECVNIILFNDSLERFSCSATGVLNCLCEDFQISMLYLFTKKSECAASRLAPSVKIVSV